MVDESADENTELKIELEERSGDCRCASVSIQLTEDDNIALLTMVDGHRQSMSTSDFLQQYAHSFKHPLLGVMVDEPEGEQAYLSYDTSDLHLLTRQVYALFIRYYPQMNTVCVKTNPASSTLKQGKIHFQMASTRKSKLLSSEQLSSFIKKRSKVPSFAYGDNYVIDSVISLGDLKANIDVELMFSRELGEHDLDTRPTEKLEIRFINEQLGMGVFAREAIGQREAIGYYVGRILSEEETCYDPENAYVFSADEGVLSLSIDAKMHGNVTRFVNHAPSDEEMKDDYLHANIEAVQSNYYGLSLIFFEAKRDIAMGEQLFVDYGSEYWDADREPVFFSSTSDQAFDQDERLLRVGSDLSSSTYRIIEDLDIADRSSVWSSKPAMILSLIVIGLFLINHVL